ncbi:MAG: hypothetical protein MZV49_17845 [Rhodopseudomonas palustris]|nr:hypothetical protein [Rhodopseudomonas palustris]
MADAVTGRGRAPFRPLTNGAKQSSSSELEKDCFAAALLAMTVMIDLASERFI